jgi:hypothetical protein
VITRSIEFCHQMSFQSILESFANELLTFSNSNISVSIYLIYIWACGDGILIFNSINSICQKKRRKKRKRDYKIKDNWESIIFIWFPIYIFTVWLAYNAKQGRSSDLILFFYFIFVMNNAYIFMNKYMLDK